MQAGKRKITRPSAGLAISLVLLLTACTSPGPTSRFDNLPERLDSLASNHEVPGFSFAIFDDREILFRHVGGRKASGSDNPVDPETVFEAASISKPLLAYIALQMAREGALALDQPLGGTEPVQHELGHDSRSQLLTPRLLLSHQGGLPNWRSRMNFEATSYDQLFGPDDRLEFTKDPAGEYGYSGEGYVLLQRVAEELSGQSLNELAVEMIFRPLGMERSSFVFDETMKGNAASGHDKEGRPDKWEVGLALASSTLHTTALDLATFGVRVATSVINGDDFAALASPVADVGSNEEWVAQWGLGMGVVTHRSGDRYLYHGGNNVIFMADFVYGVKENLGYALLTNSANGGDMIDDVRLEMFGRAVPHP